MMTDEERDERIAHLVDSAGDPNVTDDDWWDEFCRVVVEVTA
jgi:hypothetical protein